MFFEEKNIYKVEVVARIDALADKGFVSGAVVKACSNHQGPYLNNLPLSIQLIYKLRGVIKSIDESNAIYSARNDRLLWLEENRSAIIVCCKDTIFTLQDFLNLRSPPSGIDSYLIKKMAKFYPDKSLAECIITDKRMIRVLKSGVKPDDDELSFCVIPNINSKEDFESLQSLIDDEQRLRLVMQCYFLVETEYVDRRFCKLAFIEDAILKKVKSLEPFIRKHVSIRGVTLENFAKLSDKQIKRFNNFAEILETLETESCRVANKADFDLLRNYDKDDFGERLNLAKQHYLLNYISLKDWLEYDLPILKNITARLKEFSHWFWVESEKELNLSDDESVIDQFGDESGRILEQLGDLKSTSLKNKQINETLMAELRGKLQRLIYEKNRDRPKL